MRPDRRQPREARSAAPPTAGRSPQYLGGTGRWHRMLGSPVIVLLPVKKRTRCRPSTEENPVHWKSNGHDRDHHGRRCRRLVVVVVVVVHGPDRDVHGHDRDVHHVCTPRTAVLQHATPLGLVVLVRGRPGRARRGYRYIPALHAGANGVTED